MRDAIMRSFSVFAPKALLGFVLGSSVFLAAGAVSAADRARDADDSAKLLAEQVCPGCHGPHGVNTLQEIPNIAAQTDVYIAAKLWQFRSQALRKPEPHFDLLGAALMDDATVESLARYFAGQPAPAPVARDAAILETGSGIYNKGTDQGVAPCATCHGTRAEGLGIVPRLAGQHARYVERQLRSIQLRLRNTRVMHGAVKDLSPEDIRAVAAYVQSR